VGQALLDELLAERDTINQRLQEILDQHTGPWGIKVSLVEVKFVDLPEHMKRAMAKQAEAERERRAKVIHADGESEAASIFLQGAHAGNGKPRSDEPDFGRMPQTGRA
jgi:regulator of protease activity HflC (stomatin/prohibitin superfamily)